MECPHCGYDYDDEYFFEPVSRKPYWQLHPLRFVKLRVRNFVRYTILRKKRPVLTLELASAILKEYYLPAVKAQLNGESPLARWREE